MSDIQQQLRNSLAGVEPLITPPPALGPPIIGTDTAGSAAGIAEPRYKSGDATTPTAASLFPTGTTDSWLPPPQVGMGGNAPASTPVVPPGTGPSYTVPTYGSGSATSPAISTFFPSFSAAGPFQPIVLTAIMNTSLETSQTPTTPGTAPITQSATPPPVIPGPPFMLEAQTALPPKPPPEPEPEDEQDQAAERERQRQLEEQHKRDLEEPDLDDEPDDEPEDPAAARVTVHRTTVSVSKPKKKKK
jgi:hypothetical protein